VIEQYAAHPLKGADAAALLRGTALHFRYQHVMHEGHSSRARLKLGFLTKRRVASAIDQVVNFIKHDKAIHQARRDRETSRGLSACPAPPTAGQ
jgi:hypothetical protein